MIVPPATPDPYRSVGSAGYWQRRGLVVEIWREIGQEGVAPLPVDLHGHPALLEVLRLAPFVACAGHERPSFSPPVWKSPSP